MRSITIAIFFISTVFTSLTAQIYGPFNWKKGYKEVLEAGIIRAYEDNKSRWNELQARADKYPGYFLQHVYATEEYISNMHKTTITMQGGSKEISYPDDQLIPTSDGQLTIAAIKAKFREYIELCMKMKLPARAGDSAYLATQTWQPSAKKWGSSTVLKWMRPSEAEGGFPTKFPALSAEHKGYVLTIVRGYVANAPFSKLDQTSFVGATIDNPNDPWTEWKDGKILKRDTVIRIWKEIPAMTYAEYQKLDGEKGDHTFTPDLSVKSYTPKTTPLPKAKFIDDVTVPDGTIFPPGKTFTKTWRLKNVGASAWTSSFSVVFHSGEKMGGKEVPLSKNVAPSESVDVSVNMTAPDKAGTYKGNWWLQSADGRFFGADGVPFYVIIEVKAQ